MPPERGCGDRHRCSAEDTPSARLASLGREAEQDDVGSGRRTGKDPVLLHLVFQPASVFSSEVELEDELEWSRWTFHPGEPVRTQVELPATVAPGLASPLHNPELAA